MAPPEKPLTLGHRTENSEDVDHKDSIPSDDVPQVQLHDAEKANNSAFVRSVADTDADEALQVAGSGPIELTEEDNRRILRKVDFYLLPLMCVVYGLQFWDKSALSYAAIMGLLKENHVTTDQYDWLTTILYLGFLVAEWPANLIMQRFPLAKFNGACILLWGVVQCCMAATKNFSQLMAVRFLLGLFEASITPGFALFTSQWYRVSEQGTRMGIWVSFNGVAQIVGGTTAYAFARAGAEGKISISAWKPVFLLTGLLTVVLGMFFLVWVPDSPHQARWLSEQDRRLAIERIRQNQQGVKNRHFKMHQFREALTDPITWVAFLYALLSNTPNGGVTAYYAILVQSFGFHPAQSLLYTTPAGAIEIVSLIVLLYLGDKFRARLLFGSFAMWFATLGILLVYCLPTHLKVGRLIGFYFVTASAVGFIAILSLIASNIAGYTKKTTVSAIYIIGFCVGNLIGPQMFRSKDAPKYTPALIAIVVMWGACGLILIGMFAYYKRENRRRDAITSAPGYQHRKNQEFLDLTDRENPEFRYMT